LLNLEPVFKQHESFLLKVRFFIFEVLLSSLKHFPSILYRVSLIKHMPCKAQPNFDMLGFSYQSFEEGVGSFYVLIFDLEIYVGFPDVFRLIKGNADAGAIDGKLEDRFGAI
jgi:hypothetical protein